MNSVTPNTRKISNVMIIFIACVIGLGIGLFGINYWHATKCASDRSPDEMEDLIEALKRRLLQAESQIYKNELLMGKVIHSLQNNLLALEKKEFEELSQHSKDEAVKTALYLANHPAPPMPEFFMKSQYKDAEELADVIDDVFSKIAEDDKYLDKVTDKEDDKVVDTPSMALTDAEAEKVCTEWKTKYNVIVGASWGDLPYDLQQKWLSYSCDYHMKGK